MRRLAHTHCNAKQMLYLNSTVDQHSLTNDKIFRLFILYELYLWAYGISLAYQIFNSNLIKLIFRVAEQASTNRNASTVFKNCTNTEINIFQHFPQTTDSNRASLLYPFQIIGGLSN